MKYCALNLVIRRLQPCEWAGGARGEGRRGDTVEGTREETQEGDKWKGHVENGRN